MPKRDTKIRLVGGAGEEERAGLEYPPSPSTDDLEACFERWAPYVGAVGLKLLGTHEGLDDLVQDVFLAAVRGLRGLRDPAAVKGWLSTVTVRLAQKRLRRERLKSFFIRRAGDEDVADASATPEQRVLLAQIYAVLKKQAVEDQVAWTLRHLEGERLEQVALLTGVSLATTKRRIKRANDAIREAVGDE